MLTIHPGEGASTRWESPWLRWRDSITAVRATSDGGQKVIAPTDCSSLFNSFTHATTIDLSAFDTSKVTNMEYMFNCCFSLVSLDLSGWDTSSVTDLYQMFFGCSSLKTVKVGDARSTASVRQARTCSPAARPS